MHRTSWAKLVGYPGFIILLFLIPALTRDPHYMFTCIMIFINIILAVSLALILATGVISFAHAAFMGIGAYTCILLGNRLGLSFWVALPLAGIIAVAVAIIIGYPTIRLKGAAFFLVTFAFNEFIRGIFLNIRRDLFGGAMGIVNISRPVLDLPVLPRLEFTSPVFYFYLGLVIMLVTILVISKIHKSRIGMVLRAISENDKLAQSVGTNLTRHKLLAFCIGCFFAGVAGGFRCHFIPIVSPYDYGFFESFYVVIYIVIGGMGRPVAGPIVGAVFLTLLSDFIASLGPYEPFVYGIALVLVMMFMPQGIVSSHRFPKLRGRHGKCRY